MIPLKSKAELEIIRNAGRILAQVINQLRAHLQAGVSTVEIDRLAEELIIRHNARPAFKGYRGFPSSVCISVNEEVVHGIPGERRLSEGDIVSLDLGVYYDGFFADAAVTCPVGEVDSKKEKLIVAAKNALREGIRRARPENRLSDISYAIQDYVEKNGFSVVRQFVGHGIGRDLHEEPEIPNFGQAHRGPRLKEGMVLAIEPMVNMGSWECEILENGWTAVTKDRLPSAHFEHTVAVTRDGPLVFTN